MEMHVASYSLTKLTAKMTRDPGNQRDHREACDESELGGRAAKALRIENHNRPLDRR